MAFLGLTYRGILTSGVNLGFGGITRRRSSYTPEAIAYFSAVESAGGTLTDNVKAEFDAFVVREKDAGRWDKYIALFPFLGGTLDGGIIDAKNLLVADKTGSNLVDADFGDVIGVTGDGTSKRLDTTLIAANIFDSNADLQFGVFTGKANTSNGFFIGAGNSTPSTTMLWFNNVNAYYGNYQTIPKAVTDSNDSSFFAFIGGQAFTMENGVSSTKITPVSYDLPTTSFGILTRRFNNSWSSGYNDGTINGAFFAKGMSEAELTDFDASYKTFVNNIITYAASQAYFSAVTASGGTLTENVQAEFTSFVSREVEAGRWSKIKRLKLPLGGTLASALIDAKTLTSPSNFNFVLSDVDPLIGLQGDGSTKYLRESNGSDDIFDGQFNWGGYLFTLNGIQTSAGDQFAFGSYASSTSAQLLYSRRFTTQYSGRGNSTSIESLAPTLPVANESIAVNKTSDTSIKTYKNGAVTSTTTTLDTGTLSTADMVYFASSNNASIIASYGFFNMGCIALWSSYSDADVAGFDTSIKTFINNITAYAAAQAYFNAVATAGGTLSSNVISEFTSFVSREVNAGRWSNYKVLYPMLGGTLGSVAINAVDPSNYNLTLNNFVSGDVDSLQGLTSDGSTKYANLNASVSTFTSTYNIGAYVHQSYIANTATYEYIFGDRTSTSNYLYLAHKYSTLYNTAFGYNNRTDFGSTRINNGDSFGMNKQSSTVYKTYINGSVDKTSSTTDTGSVPVGNLYLFANNFSTGLGYPTAATINGFTMWTNFTDADVSGFDTSYKTFINAITAYAQAEAYLDAVVAAGGTVSTNVVNEFTAFALREGEAGRWSKLKRLYPFLGGTINSAVIDAVTLGSAINTNFVDADANPTIGLQGDAVSTKYLTDYQVWSNIISSQYKVTIGNFYGSGLNQENSNPYIFGSISSGNYITTRILSTSTIARSYVGLSSPFSQVARTLLSNESVIATRLSNVYSATLVSGSTDLVDTSTTTYSMPANEPSYFKANGAGGISQGLSNGFFIAEFDTLQEVKDFESSYKTFINNIKAYEALMDSYSGASAAYSLRKLYSSYEGPAINVRRSSDNATQDIGFDGYVLDTASLLSFVGAGSGYVTTWYDQSGSGNNATQGTAANQPLIVSSGSLITTNGLPAIDFDIDDHLSFTAITPITTFTVGKLDALSLLNYILYNLTAGRGYIYGGSLAGADGIGVYDGAVKTITGEDLNSHLAYFNYDSTLYQVAKDGTTATNLAAGANFEVNQIGRSTSNLSFNGTIQEIVSYSIDNSLNKAAIESLINTYYGIY